jgi:hypothetical protein
MHKNQHLGGFNEPKRCGAPLTISFIPCTPLIRIVLIILALVFSGVTAPGQQASKSPAKPNPAPTPIPLTKVPLEAQSALASLQEIEADVAKGSVEHGRHRPQSLGRDK